MTKPNILLIILDSMRHDTFEEKTLKKLCPNLSKLKKESTFFKNAYAQGPWTVPSHISLFTGLYPSEHNMMFEALGKQILLPPKYVTLPQILKKNGYRTAGFSSNPWIGELSNTNRGYDLFIEANLSVSRNSENFSSWPLIFSFISLVTKPRKLRNSKTVSRVIQYVLSHPRITNKLITIAQRWIDQVSREPFFGFINLMNAHPPYAPSKSFMRKATKRSFSPNRIVKTNYNILRYTQGKHEMNKSELNDAKDMYLASIMQMDYELGRLVDYLKSRDLFKKTVLIIVPDHGKNLGDHSRSNDYHQLTDIFLKTPIIVHYPKSFKKGVEIDRNTDIIDIYYTILSLSGIQAQRKRDSLMDVVKGFDKGFAYAETPIPFSKQGSEKDYVRIVWMNGIKFVRSKVKGDVIQCETLGSEPRITSKGMMKNIGKGAHCLDLFDSNLIKPRSKKGELDGAISKIKMKGRL